LKLVGGFRDFGDERLVALQTGLAEGEQDRRVVDHNRNLDFRGRHLSPQEHHLAVRDGLQHHFSCA